MFFEFGFGELGDGGGEGFVSGGGEGLGGEEGQVHEAVSHGRDFCGFEGGENLGEEFVDGGRVAGGGAGLGEEGGGA